MTSEITPIYDTNRTILSNEIPLETPYSVYVFPTNVCNFKCVYCAHSLSTSEMKRLYDFSKGTMSLSTYKNVIEQLIEFPQQIKLLSLTGQGEPLVNKEIGKMVETAKRSEKFERVEIITNASLLTPRMTDNLISSGLDTLRVSMQGLNSAKYKELCKTDFSFEQIMENIRYFYRAKNKTKLFVKILDVSLEKEGDEDLFYELFSDCSDKMFVEKVQPTYSGVELTDLLDNEHDRYGRIVAPRSVCPLAFFMLGILPNGDIKPCDSIYKPVILGNVNETTIKEAWGSQKLHDFWMMHLEKGKNANSKCRVCSAPNDVAQPEDVLDGQSNILLEKFKELFV